MKTVRIKSAPAFEVIPVSLLEATAFTVRTLMSVSAEPAAASVNNKPPSLSNLSVSLERVNVGMSDFVIQVVTPKYESMQKGSGTVVGIRGSKALCKSDKVQDLAAVIAEELRKRGDKTYDWSKVNTQHLAGMLYGPLKYFSTAQGLVSLNFVTDAVL